VAAHLDERSGDSRAQAVYALMSYGRSRAWSEPYRPAWLPKVRREVLQSLRSLPLPREQEYLTQDWGVLRGPEAIAPLEALLDLPAPRGAYDAADVWRMAVKRLHEVDSPKAEARLIAELRQPDTRLDAATAALLPPGSIAERTPALIDALAEAQRTGGDWHRIMDLLARYGSPKALGRMKAIYESQTEHCQPELLAYFLRVDPDYADRILHERPWDMHADPPPCANRWFGTTARIDMAPALEKFAVAYLMHSNVETKMQAAQALGKFGSKAAEAPLWNTLRYFHDWWKDRRAQIKEQPQNQYLEVELRNALARARNWLADEADLRTLAALCISDRCAMETDRDLQTWRAPMLVDVAAGWDGFRAAVAQYPGLASVEELENKLAQFPRGSRFLLRVHGEDREAIADRVMRFGASRGLMLK
jgi:hypothetical protein